MPQDRVTGADAALLRLEDAGGLVHVATLLEFEGPAPAPADFLAHVERRLALLPRARRKLAFPPLGQGRAVWVDDHHFNLAYHVRPTALPPPAGADALGALLAQLLAQRLDRSQPLWEAWLVEGVAADRFAVLLKSHPALVAPGEPDLAAALLAPADPGARPWIPRPAASAAELVADVVVDRAQGLLGVLADPGAAAQWVRAAVERADRPPSPLELPGGPHRRFAWFSAPRPALEWVVGATAGALREHLRAHGYGVPAQDLVALVAAGSDARLVPLPVAAAEAVARRRLARAGLGDLAPPHSPSALQDAARAQAVERGANLTIALAPAPRGELLGHRLLAAHPAVPLPPATALGVALALGEREAHVGVLGDPDALPDPDGFADRLGDALRV